MSMKPYVIGGLVGSVLTLATVWGGWPYISAWHAERLYRSVPYDAEFGTLCGAAMRAAEAWEAAGVTSRMQSWNDQARTDCAIDRLRAL